MFKKIVKLFFKYFYDGVYLDFELLDKWFYFMCLSLFFFVNLNVNVLIEDNDFD